MDRLKLYFFILHLSVICSVTTFAGVPDSTITKTDSTEEWHDWDDMKDDDFEWTDADEEKWKRYVKRSCCWGWSDKPEFMDLDFTDVYNEYESPFISFRYGNVNHSLKNLRIGLQKTGLAELQLGYQDISQLEKDSPITGYTSNFFRGGKYSVDLKSESLLSNDIEAEIWRFGIGWDKGYGYDMGVSKLVLYNSFGINWSRLRVNDTLLYTADANQLALYNNSFRFGLSAEGGAKFYLIENLSVEATYERSLVYPRLLFWRTTGSLLAEGIGHWLVDEFMLRVKNNSPFVVPVLNFLLQNGVSYAVYELRKDEMNFPFGGNTPLMQETFKFGVTFIF